MKPNSAKGVAQRTCGNKAQTRDTYHTKPNASLHLLGTKTTIQSVSSLICNFQLPGIDGNAFLKARARLANHSTHSSLSDTGLS